MDESIKQYIDKSAVVAEIERIMAEEMSFFKDCCEDELENTSSPAVYTRMEMLLSFLDTLKVKEFQKKKLYVVTRCEEHSDYVEKVFFSKKKAEEYCKQFEGNEDAYGRDITEIEVDCPLEVKGVDLEEEVENWVKTGPHTSYPWCTIPDAIRITAEHFFELGLKAKGE